MTEDRPLSLIQGMVPKTPIELICNEMLEDSEEESDTRIPFVDNNYMAVHALFHSGVSKSLLLARLDYYYDIMNDNIHGTFWGIKDDEDQRWCSFCNYLEPEMIKEHFIYTPDVFHSKILHDESYNESEMFCVHCRCFLWDCSDIVEQWDPTCREIHEEHFVTECANDVLFTE